MSATLFHTTIPGDKGDDRHLCVNPNQQTTLHIQLNCSYKLDIMGLFKLHEDYVRKQAESKLGPGGWIGSATFHITLEKRGLSVLLLQHF